MSQEDETKAPDTGQGKSEDKDTIAAARAVGNTWEFEGRELEMFVARGEAAVATSIVEPGGDSDTGASLIHRFGWTKPDPFVIRENSFKTNLSRVGRRAEQKINTAHLATVNATFYKGIITGGSLIESSANSKHNTQELSQAQMLDHANIYPESASEAIESWLDAAVVERLSDKGSGFEFLFKAPDVIRILWYLGLRDQPTAAGVFNFRAPTSERRATYDESVQNVETKRRGDVSSTEIEENFLKKVQYGAEHLLNVEGVAVGAEGKPYDMKSREEFITLFNPIWFGDIVDTMHSTFDFMKGKSKQS